MFDSHEGFKFSGYKFKFAILPQSAYLRFSLNFCYFVGFSVTRVSKFSFMCSYTYSSLFFLLSRI